MEDAGFTRFRRASQITWGHMTATFSQGASGERTGLSPERFHAMPSALVA